MPILGESNEVIYVQVKRFDRDLRRCVFSKNFTVKNQEWNRIISEVEKTLQKLVKKKKKAA